MKALHRSWVYRQWRARFYAHHPCSYVPRSEHIREATRMAAQKRKTR